MQDPVEEFTGSLFPIDFLHFPCWAIRPVRYPNIINRNKKQSQHQMPDNDSNNSTNLGHTKYCDLPVSCLLAAAFNIQL